MLCSSFHHKLREPRRYSQCEGMQRIAANDRALSRIAPIDRDSIITDSVAQNRHGILTTQRCRLERLVGRLIQSSKRSGDAGADSHHTAELLNAVAYLSLSRCPKTAV